MDATITVSIDGDFCLSVTDVFPDGAPEGWTITDVIDAIRETRNPEGLISDWCMTPRVSVTIDRPNPAYGGDEVLFGDPPSRYLTETAEVWR